jgi:hypothetical protein
VTEERRVETTVETQEEKASEVKVTGKGNSNVKDNRHGNEL